MKSIIQEASSLAKAVEEGWLKAQKPRQFSVKVLEEAEKNFLGLTKKSAKIAIFFDENHPTKKPEPKNGAYAYKAASNNQKRTPPSAPPIRTQQEKSQPASMDRLAQQPQHAQSFSQKGENISQPAGQLKKQFEPLWNQAMVERTQQWMKDAFKNSHNEKIQFTVEPQKFHLRITLSEPILPDVDKEKQLLASFSALILETLKRSFKLSLRGHKIVLTHKK